jgi:predicted dehydrogenase
MISGAHAAAAAAAGMRVVAVASRTEQRATAVARRVGATAVRYADLPAGGDIVVVATPPAQHAAHTLQALRAGAAAVIEKPLCRSLAEADTLVEAAAAHGQRAMYAENLAYAPVVKAFVHHARSFPGLRHLEVRAINPLPAWGDFTTDEWGGGALFDLGVHPLAVALLAAAPDSVVSVTAALEGSPTGAHGTDEHATVDLQFDSGLVAHVVSSFRGGDQPLWDAQAASDDGVVRAELLPVPSLERNGDAVPLPAPSTKPAAIEQYGYSGQLTAFATDLDRGQTPVMSVAFGRTVLDIVCAAYTSGRTGEPEAVPFSGRRDRTPLQLWRGV